MNRFLLVMACTLLCVRPVFSQNSYVVTFQNDTLSGNVSFINGGPYAMDQVFVRDGKTKKRLTPLKVKEVVRGNERFVPGKINGKYQFAKVITEGYLSVHKFLDPQVTTREDFTLFFLIKKDGTQQQISNIGFSKAVSKFLGDFPGIKKWQDDKKLKFKYLYDIVDDYNTWIAGKAPIYQTQEVTQETEEPEDTSEIQNLINLVKKDKSLSKDDELIEMLEDAKDKLAKGDVLPKYLRGAIEESLGNDEGLLETFQSLVN